MRAGSICGSQTSPVARESRMCRAITALVLLACFGCSSNKSSTANADEYIVDCTVNANQFASDESFVKFIEAEAARRVTADDCKSPELLGPSSGATLSAGAPPLFLFNPIHTCGAQGPRARLAATRSAQAGLGRSG